jgi:tetratricopeptide (TPR) repeat protein
MTMPRAYSWLALAAGSLLLAACQGGGAAKPGPATPTTNQPPAATTQPATPDKGDPEQRFQAALKLMKDKKPADAKDAFAKLAQDFPQYAGPLNDLGVLQAQGKQRDQAIASFGKAVQINAKDDFAWAWLGILYREGNDYNRSEQAYLKALALAADRPSTHLNLGILYDAYLKRPKDALAQYREYQRLAGANAKPIVAAWINELQDGMPQAAAAPAAGQVTPAAGTPPPVEHKP